MGRMFRIITEGSLDYPGRSAATATEPGPFGDSSAPYVEVGGPQPIFHGIPKLPSRVTVPNAAPQTAAVIKETTQPAPQPATIPAKEESRYLGAKMHGIAPRVIPKDVPPVHPSIVAFHHPELDVCDEYRNLSGEIQTQIGQELASKVVLFTASASDHGTTTVLLNIAVTLAKEPHKRVLVVDADFDRPGAAGMLGLSDIPGLSDVLSQSMPLAWVLQPTPIAKLQVLGAGKPKSDTLPLMSTDFPKLINQLRQWYDWILVDGGVWGERPHRDATSPSYDGIYLVTRQSEMDRPVFNSLRSQVAKHGGLLRGFISTSV